MKKSISFALGALVFTGSVLFGSEKGVDADKALKMLMEGNKRFSTAKMIHPDLTLERRKEVTAGQNPIAVIVSCSDSRVPPELVFDEGIGDLFVVRAAGNVVDDVALGSVEYAVEHLGAKLIMVLGHEKCGAVKATVDGGEIPGHIGSIVEKIKPALEIAKGEKGDLLDNTIIENVKLITAQIAGAKPIISEKEEKKEIKVIGGRYDLDTGIVELVK